MTAASPTPDAEKLGPEILGWDQISQLSEGLAFASRSLHGATCPVTAAYDLGPRGAWILNLIDNGRTFPRDLANSFRIGRSLITAELTRLTAAGLIDTRPGAKDRRKTELALTPLGQQACQQIRDEMSAILSRNLAAYSADDICLLTRMLRDVHGQSFDNTEPFFPQPAPASKGPKPTRPKAQA